MYEKGRSKYERNEKQEKGRGRKEGKGEGKRENEKGRKRQELLFHHMLIVKH